MRSAGPLRGVAIGAGYFAAFHYDAWTRLPDADIVALHDRDEARAEAMRARFGVPRTYPDWRAMIDAERPDFVDVITPPPTHEEMCAYAAAHGVHVICQKPLAPSSDACVRIVDNANAAGVRFMVHENWRWQPWYREVKRIQREGRIGAFTHVHFRMRMGDGWGPDAYLARQPYFRDYPRLLVYETGVHFIDTFRFLLGEVESVYAHLRRLNPVIRGEDEAQVFLRFESGATAAWDANRYNETEAASPRYTFGEMRIDATGGHLELAPDGRMRVKPLGAPAEDVSYAHDDRNFAGDCVHATVRHFVECLRSGAPFETSGRDYLKTVAVVEAAYESASRGEVVRLTREPREPLGPL
jgi:D-apiose dehydrogenase